MEPTEMRATAIRAELKKRGLDSKGPKILLISRLQFALDEEHRQTDEGEDSATNNSESDADRDSEIGEVESNSDNDNGSDDDENNAIGDDNESDDDGNNAIGDVILNCGHYCFCLTCFEAQKADVEAKKIEFQLGRRDVEPKLECAICKTKITAHMHIKQIFTN